jgi:hypothetical protein
MSEQKQWEDLPDGIYPNIPADHYHALKRLSSSQCKTLAYKGPAHWKAEQDEPRESTPAQQWGTVLHCVLLEPHNLDNIIIELPSDAPKKPTKAQWNAKKPSDDALTSMAYWTAFNDRIVGRIVMTAEEIQKVGRAADAVRRSNSAMSVLDGSKTEYTVLWTDSVYNIRCKMRMDAFNERSFRCADLKKTQDARPAEFGRSAAGFGYHLQSAFYNIGAEQGLDSSFRSYDIVAIEEPFPHGVKVYQVQNYHMLSVMSDIDRAMRLYAEIQNTGFHRSYTDEIQPLQLPHWAMKRDPTIPLAVEPLPPESFLTPQLA